MGLAAWTTGGAMQQWKVLVACALAVAGGVIGLLVARLHGPGPTPASSTTVVATEASRPITAATTRFGMNGPQVWTPESIRLRELDEMKRLGVKLVRMDAPWGNIEVSNDVWTFKKIDSQVNAVLARDMTPLLVPTYCTPAWANSDAGCYAPPRDAEEYGEFVGHLVARYAPKGVHYYEIWNEPNSSAFFRPEPDVAKYTQMLKSAYTNAHAQDASALVICCALSWGADDEPVAFIKGVYSNGGHGYFDAVSVHPYTFLARVAQFPNTVWPGSTDDVYELMTNNGDRRLKIWATEFGAPSGPSTGCTDGCSELNQREAVIEAVDRWGGRHSFGSYLGPLFIYHFRDECTDGTRFECFFGLIRNDWTQKPAYSAYRDALSMAAADAARNAGRHRRLPSRRSR